MKSLFVRIIYIFCLWAIINNYKIIAHKENNAQLTIVKSQDNFFKEYDLRGCVGKDFEVKNIYSITCAIASFFIQTQPSIKNIAVGMDGRLHSLAIKQEVCRACIDSGLNVVFIGLCTTPVMHYATHTLDVDAGIMITASHNPKEDNGLKIVLGKESVCGDQIKTIRDIYNSNAFMSLSTKGIYSEHFLCQEYVDYLVSRFPHLANGKIKCIIDCGNGAAGAVMPLLIKKMEWNNVLLMNSEINGNFPHHDPDPTVEKNVQDVKEYMIQHKEISCGMALDGDCDRLAVITKNGYLIPGDQLIGVFSQSIEHWSDKKAIVVDIMCSNAIVEQLIALGFSPCFARTGISFIKEAMRLNNALLGGELSGHICFKDRYFGYDDGVYALLRMIEMMQVSGNTLEEMLEVFPHKHRIATINIACLAERKFVIIEQVKKLFRGRSDFKMVDIDGIRLNASYGCAILRASNTEPLIRLRIEAKTQADILKFKREFFYALEPHFDHMWLQKQLSM